MYAVEFDTKITDGFIKIPSEHRDLSHVENVRLVVMYSENENNLKQVAKSSISKAGDRLF